MTNIHYIVCYFENIFQLESLGMRNDFISKSRKSASISLKFAWNWIGQFWAHLSISIHTLLFLPQRNQ